MDEIKLPEPAFKLRWHSERACYTVSKPGIGDTDVYTADQLRAALSAAQDAPACLSKPGDPETQSALPLADAPQCRLAAQAVPEGFVLVPKDALLLAGAFALPAMEQDRDGPSNSAWMVEAANRNIDKVRAMLATASEPTEPLVRYCPGCGSIGPVDYSKHRDCCPDGNEARLIPQALAQKCHDTFRLAIDGVLAAPPVPQPARKPLPEAPLAQEMALLEEEHGNSAALCFLKGVRFAERMHGIGE